MVRKRCCVARATTTRRQLNRLFLFDRCTKYGIPAMCFHIFPTCDARTQDSKPRLCREDCFALFEDVCLTELQLAQMDPQFSTLLPNCSALPTRDNIDHSFCTSLGIPGQFSRLRAVPLSVGPSSENENKAREKWPRENWGRDAHCLSLQSGEGKGTRRVSYSSSNSSIPNVIT